MDGRSNIFDFVARNVAFTFSLYVAEVDKFDH